MIEGNSSMEQIDMAIENVRKSFLDMRRAVTHYNKVNKKRKKHLRSMIKIEEWPEVKSKMKAWLDITQRLVEKGILFTGFDLDCVFGQKYMKKKLPKLHVVGSNRPPNLEKLVKEWEELMQYLLSKGFLDKIPDIPGFELRDYILGVQELVKIVEEN